MEDDIYGDLELSSSSSSSSTSRSSVSAKTNDKDKQQTEEDEVTGLPSPPVDNDDKCTKEKRSLSRSSPKKKTAKDEDDDIDTMDLMDEGLTNKFKEMSQRKMSDYSRAKAPPTRSNDIQVEKLKHEIAELKKVNHQLEINLALLYKSSHHIISLKDKELTKLKSKYDAMCFRRKQTQDSAKSLPLIAPQVFNVAEARSIPRTEQGFSNEHVTALSSATSREKMTDELASLRNYLPKCSQRAPSESSCKNQESTGRRADRKKSPVFEDTRLFKENKESDNNSRYDRRRDDRRGGKSHRDRSSRRDSRDRYQRDRHRDAQANDNRDKRLDTDRRERRSSPDVSHRREDRKRKAESEIENAKRQRGHDRRTLEDSCRITSIRSEREKMNRSEHRKLSSSNSDKSFRRSVSPRVKKCRTPPLCAESHADLNAVEDTRKRLSHKGSVEIDSKVISSRKQTPECEMAKEDGEISESGTDNSSQMTQELRRSPRKHISSKTFPVKHRASSPELKPEEQLVGIKSSQVCSSASTKSRTKQNNAHASMASQEGGSDNGPRTPVRRKNREAISPKRSAKKANEGSLTPRRTLLDKTSPPNKFFQLWDNGASTSRCTTPTLRRSPRKSVRDRCEQLVTNFPHLSPTNSESPKPQPSLRDHPCKIPSKTSHQVEDPRDPTRVNETEELLTVPQYLEGDPGSMNSENNNDKKLYRCDETPQLKAETMTSQKTPLRCSPRKKPRSLSHCSIGETESPANVSSYNELTFFDQLPLKTRTSLSSDNDKPKTPTLSPALSSITPTGSVVGQSLVPLHSETFGWNDPNLTPIDSSVPPETPGKEFSATPLAVTTKNGKSVDDVGRILQFDKIT